MSPAENQAIKDFEEIAQKIADIKRRKGHASPVPRTGEIEQLLIDIRYCKKHHPEFLEAIRKELQHE